MDFDDTTQEEPLMAERAVEDAEMDITPMIDITFLLLIFFIVAAKIDSQKAGELPQAEAGINVVAEKSIIILVSKQGENVVVTSPLRGTPFSADDQAQVDEIKEFLTNIIEKDEGEKVVLVQAAVGVKHKDVSRVARAVGEVGEESTRQIYVAVKQFQ